MLIFIGLFTLVPAAMFIIYSDFFVNQRRLTRKHTTGVIQRIEHEKNHLIYHVEFTDDKDRVLVGRSLPYSARSTCAEGEMVNIRYGMDEVGKVLVQIDEQSAIRKEQGVSTFAVLLYVMAVAALITAVQVFFLDSPGSINYDATPRWWALIMTAIAGFIFFGLLWQTPFTVLPKWKRSEGEIESFISHESTGKTVYYIRFRDGRGKEKIAHTIGYADHEGGTYFGAGQKVKIRYAHSLFGKASMIIDEKPCLNENDEKYLPATLVMIITISAFLLIVSLILLRVIPL